MTSPAPSPPSPPSSHPASHPPLVAMLSAVGVGTLTAIQGRINGELSVLLGNGVQAALVSFGVGLALLCAMAVFMPRVRAAIAGLRGDVGAGRLAWWALLGGIGGGFFVAVQSVTVPLVGVAVFTVGVVGGQTASSLLVDRAGLGPAGRQPVTAARVLAAVIAVLAVLVVVSDRLGGGNAAVAVPAAIAAAMAGAVISVQQAINGRVSAVSGQPLAAAWVNFVGGVAFLVLALTVSAAALGHGTGALPSSPWWAYLGGVIGVVFIATAAWVVRVLGVLLFVLLAVSGQLIGALLLDLVLPTPGTSVGWHLVAGVALTLVAVVIASRGRVGPRP